MRDGRIIIEVKEKEVQELTEKYFGTKLTDKEVEDIERIFNVDRVRCDDGGWEGVVGLLIHTITSAIGLVIADHRKTRWRFGELIDEANQK